MDSSEKEELIQWTKQRLDDATKIVLELQERMKQRGEKVQLLPLMGTLLAAVDITMIVSISSTKNIHISELAVKALEHSLLNAIKGWRKEIEEQKEKEKHN